ncbi:type III pantothenate kinase [Lacrimispora sp. NSJ-141]|uniref:Type III pantothenate kinase n=1 Tax=Lientehia hominis TaxID=2897778 RepID=A0AAP2W6E8_9FIRM|nr:type III pantothenate kinase [Lientehia hominis]MCD2491233.1 type III pantothenate kinase [Lientehia hominis]
MILAIDIGNSNVVVGCIDAKQTYFVERISTNVNLTVLEYAVTIKNILELYHINPKGLEGAIISSVVPPISNTVKLSVEKIIGKPCLLVGPGIKTGLNIVMDNPATVGSDLVVTAVAGIKEYKAPFVVIDMGTATTISCVDRHHNYIGGAIMPGIRVSLESLAQKAAQLYTISLETPKHVIGKNTIECMRSGIVLGSASMLDGMIDRFAEELGEAPVVIATGGLSKTIIPHCRHEIIYDDSLLLKGLWIIYAKNQ